MVGHRCSPERLRSVSAGLVQMVWWPHVHIFNMLPQLLLLLPLLLLTGLRQQTALELRI
jgi:hypothetical protein